ncbi:MAG: 50S ribosomal protein L34, partial [Actinobacteria bacterium]|nr:50S ribosomal protein L34 [Actinomycetota bacterium]
AVLKSRRAKGRHRLSA